MDYAGITFYGYTYRESSEASKDLAPKCWKEFVKDWKDCVGDKQV